MYAGGGKKQKRCLKPTDNKLTEIDREQKLKQTNMPPRKDRSFRGMFADYAAINSRKHFDYGLLSKCFIFCQASANGSACLALKSFNRLVEGSDDGLPAGLAFNELDGSFNLGQHGAGCEMPFRHIAASLFNGHG